MNMTLDTTIDNLSGTGASDARIFHATLLDGRTALRQTVSLRKQGTALVLQSEQGERVLRAQDVLPIHPSRTGVQFLRLRDGATLEMPASPALLAALRDAGVAVNQESALSALLSGDWRAAAMALGFLAAVLAVFYISLLPHLAELVADAVPETMERRIGEHALQHLSGKFTPSELPQAQQDAIQDRFAALTSELEGPEAKDLELLIRKSTIGPNAIALPGNYIVLTDELVTLVDGDLDAISGVLGHEVGHLHHKHGLRSVAQAAALTVLGSALIGDYSSVLALVPTALGHLNYSRRFESEADVYARTMLCTNGIDPAKTSLFFDRAGKLKGNLESVLPGYLQSHPASAERADYFRTSCQKAP